MPITIDSQHDDQDYTALPRASARGWLWEAGEQIREDFPQTEAFKDATGLHIRLCPSFYGTEEHPQQPGDEPWTGNAEDAYLHLRVTDKRGRLTLGGRVSTRWGFARTEQDERVFLEERGGIEIEDLRQALADAIQWGRSRLGLAAGEGYAEKATA